MDGYKNLIGYGQVIELYWFGPQMRATIQDLEKGDPIEILDDFQPPLTIGQFVSFSYTTIPQRVVNVQRIIRSRLPPHLKSVI